MFEIDAFYNLAKALLNKSYFYISDFTQTHQYIVVRFLEVFQVQNYSLRY